MADFYQWDPNTLGVKVQEMDNEHILLIKKMNALHEAYVVKKPKAALTPLLNDFVNYTVQHFKDEEAYMAKIGFAGIETHKIIHKQLLGEVQKYASEFEKTGQLTDAFFKFLSVWLTSHIRGIDIKYSQKS